MKQRIINLLLLAAMILCGSTMVSAQSKALAKDIKKTTKEWKKAGWTMLASASTMDYALTKYRTYIEGDEENRISLIGIAIGSNPKIGRDNATMSAVSNYAMRAKAQVVGKAKSIASSDNSSMTTEEIDKFGQAYEMAVNTKIAGLVKEHFAMVRNVDGKKEFQVFLSIDETQAKKAREAAAREAKQKAALKDLSKEVEDFIGEHVAQD